MQNIYARLVTRHDLEAAWIHSSFIPLKGEQVIYDVEVDESGNILQLPQGRTVPYAYPRLKIGDGFTTINDLPFIGVSRGSNINNSEEGLQTKAEAEESHAEGYGSIAQDKYSHAEGWETIANGIGAHTEGYKSQAEGNYGHAEGYNTRAGIKGQDTATAHAEGYTTQALGHSSHAEGRSTQALAYASHAEGRGTIAEKNHSHAEGYSTQAKGENSHAEGTYVVAFGAQSHAEGRGQTSTDVITDGVVTNIGYSSGVAISNATHIEGYMSIAGQMGYYIYSIDFTNIDAPVITLSKNREAPTESFRLCLFEGEVANNMIAKNEYQVGDYVTIVNGNVFANCATITSINNNVITTTALPFTTFEKTSPDSYIKNYTLCVNAKPRIGATDLGEDAHAEGRSTKALHFCAHAEGDNCIVTGKASHAEGHSTKAYGPSAHSENWGSEAHGANSHAGGSNCKSIGNSSFAHGQNSQANGISSFVFGIGLVASGDYQTVVGQYNEAVADALFIVGCGTSTKRENAFIVYKDGSTWMKQQKN